LNTISAYQNGVAIKWHDAELAIYLVFIFGEINKSKYISLSAVESTINIDSWRERSCSILQSTSRRQGEKKGNRLF
jgi:hypothetical protein